MSAGPPPAGLLATRDRLGTDGFGRSDYRVKPRFFEVDRHQVAVTALWALAAEGGMEPATAAAAIERYGIDAEAEAPWRR